MTVCPYALVLLCAPLPGIAQTLAPADTTARAVDRLFDDWRGTERPGCAVGVSRRGQTVYERGFGMANLETATPIRSGTIFQAASIAKQFTAMAVMLLVRDGKLSLDDDIRKFIPELPDYGTRITVRHLLTHTSGLRDFFEMLIIARGRFEEDRITEADMTDVVWRQKKLNFTPGDEFLYSNTGYALAEVIVKRVSGESLRDFAAKRIFTPLGMLNTQFRDNYTTLVPGRAEGYGHRGSGWRSSTPNYDVYGPTNLFTTVGDLLIWAANLDNPQVGDASIVRQMSTSAVLRNGDSSSYGFGLSLVNDRGARVVEHEGGDPGFHSYLGRYPDHRLAIAVLCNAPTNPVALGHAIAGVYLGSVLKAAPTDTGSTPSSVSLQTLAKRTGVYFQPRTLEVLELTLRNGELFTARQGGLKLRPIGNNLFLLAGRPIEYLFGQGVNSGFVARSLVPGHHTAAFEWKAPFVMTAGALAPYIGEYFSEDLNSVYHVTAGDSTLLLKTGTSDGITARPAFADSFVSGQLTIQFIRNGTGVSGFEITHPRARRLAFTRINRVR
jgi:CubicO group peptidase (beta-lactamase class C family)